MPILEALRQVINLLLVDPGARLANAFFGHPRHTPAAPGWTLAEIQALYPGTPELGNVAPDFLCDSSRQ